MTSHLWAIETVANVCRRSWKITGSLCVPNQFMAALRALQRELRTFGESQAPVSGFPQMNREGDHLPNPLIRSLWASRAEARAAASVARKAHIAHGAHVLLPGGGGHLGVAGDEVLGVIRGRGSRAYGVFGFRLPNELAAPFGAAR